jgi:hypothetical protein
MLVVTAERVTVTSDVDGVQVIPIDVHRKTFGPAPRPDTSVEEDVGLAMDPAPDMRDHVPVLGLNVLDPVLNVPPVVSVFPTKVVVDAQPTLVLVPALAVVGHEAHRWGKGRMRHQRDRRPRQAGCCWPKSDSYLMNHILYHRPDRSKCTSWSGRRILRSPRLRTWPLSEKWDSCTE